MLTPAQENLLQQLTTKKGRKEAGKFIIEGEKFVRDVSDLIEFEFTPADTKRFAEYVSTETPQAIAGVARLPNWNLADVQSKSTIVVLDGVQDPGNVGTILRVALGFDASVILIESAEVTNPKVVRASASAIVRVPWLTVPRSEAVDVVNSLNRIIYKLELKPGAMTLAGISSDPCVIIAGNEGAGITLPIDGTSVMIPINRNLESLNVAVATSLALYERSRI